MPDGYSRRYQGPAPWKSLPEAESETLEGPAADAPLSFDHLVPGAQAQQPAAAPLSFDHLIPQIDPAAGWTAEEPGPQGKTAAQASAFARGAVTGTGGVLSGLGTATQMAGVRNTAAALNVINRVDRGERVPDQEDVLGYQYMSPEQRAQAKGEIATAARRPGEERAAGIADFNREPDDLTDKFNTVLSPPDEAKFQAWAAANNKIGDLFNYDLRGAWKSGAEKSGNGHLPDTFKKPNHPTFSDQSQYSGPETPGGHWEQKDGKWTFTPSETNLRQYGPGRLRGYFKQFEPDAEILGLPPAAEKNLLQRAGEAVTGFGERTFKVAPEQAGIMTNVAGMLGSMAPIILGGAAGAVAGGPLGAAAVVTPAIWAQSYDSTFQDAVSKGASPQVADRAALTNAATQAAMMSVPVGRLFQVVPEQFREGLFRTMLNLGKHGVEFGSLSAAGRFAQNYVAQQSYNPEQKLMEGVGEAGLEGAIAGLIVPAVTGALRQPPQAAPGMPELRVAPGTGEPPGLAGPPGGPEPPPVPPGAAPQAAQPAGAPPKASFHDIVAEGLPELMGEPPAAEPPRGRGKRGTPVPPTTPEPTSDVLAQIEAVRNPESGKDTAFFAAGTSLPPIPTNAGLTVQERPEGVLVTRDVAKAKAFRQAPKLTDEFMAQLLGYAETKPDAIASGQPVVVQGTNPAGAVVTEALASPAGVPAAQEAAQAQVPPGGDVRVVTPQQAQQRRDELGTPVTGFTTAKGSVYQVHDDGTTSRNKAARPEHPGDEGPQPQSQATVYVTPEQAGEWGLFQAEGLRGKPAILPLGDGRWGLKYLTGPDAGKFEKRTVLAPQTQPAVGLLPVETWKDGTRVHFGNPITAVQRSAAAPPSPEQTATVGDQQFRIVREEGAPPSAPPTYRALDEAGNVVAAGATRAEVEDNLQAHVEAKQKAAPLDFSGLAPEPKTAEKPSGIAAEAQALINDDGRIIGDRDAYNALSFATVTDQFNPGRAAQALEWARSNNRPDVADAILKNARAFLESQEAHLEGMSPGPYRDNFVARLEENRRELAELEKPVAAPKPPEAEKPPAAQEPAAKPPVTTTASGKRPVTADEYTHLETTAKAARSMLTTGQRDRTTPADKMARLIDQAAKADAELAGVEGPPPRPSAIITPGVKMDVDKMAAGWRRSTEAHELLAAQRMHHEGAEPVADPDGVYAGMAMPDFGSARGTDSAGVGWGGNGAAIVRLDADKSFPGLLKRAEARKSVQHRVLDDPKRIDQLTDAKGSDAPITWEREVSEIGGQATVIGRLPKGARIAVRKPIFDLLSKAAGEGGTFSTMPEKKPGKQTSAERVIARRADGEVVGVGMPIRMDPRFAEIYATGKLPEGAVKSSPPPAPPAPTPVTPPKSAEAKPPEAPEPAAPAAEGERPVDVNGNPIFKVGERVVIPEGERVERFPGRHGVVKEAIHTVMQGYGGPKESRGYSYEVVTDAGSKTHAQKLEAEVGPAPEAIPDIKWEKVVMDPDAMRRSIAYDVKDAERARGAAARAIKPENKRSHTKAAADIEERTREKRALLTKWAETYPEEAERVIPGFLKPKGAAPPESTPPAEAPSGMAIVKAKHTKHGHDLWVVTTGDRVDGIEFNRRRSLAKDMGGDYSSFRGRGAVPGFQFREEAKAQEFLRKVGGEPAKAPEPAAVPKPVGERPMDIDAFRGALEQGRALHNGEWVIVGGKKYGTLAVRHTAPDGTELTYTGEDISEKPWIGNRAAVDGATQIAFGEVTPLGRHPELGMPKTTEEWWDKSLTPFGRRNIMKAASVNLPDGVLWYHVAPDVRKKLLAHQYEHTPKAEPAEAPKPAEAPTPTVMGKTPEQRRIVVPANELEAPAWREIGHNLEGHPVSQDQRGIRSYVANRMRIAEPVQMIPSREGILMSVRHVLDKADEFLTAEEYHDQRRGAAEQPAEPPPKAEQPKAEEPKAAQPDHALAEHVADVIADPTRELTARSLQQEADRIYGGTLASGAYTRDRLYDAIELGVNRYIQRNPEQFSPLGGAAHAHAAIDDLRAMKDRLPTQTVRAGEKDTHQQFSTPPDYSYAAAWVSGMRPGEVVLEPSAGTGSLAVHAMNAGAEKVYGNEISPKRRTMLEALGLDGITAEDAGHINNVLPDEIRPTVVLMNPPFSAAAGRMGDRMVLGEGARHVEQALARLEPGGRLVAIVGRGMAPDAATFKDWWRKVGAQYDIRANLGVSGAIYRKYGTTFPTRLLVIDKVPPSGRPVIQGDVENADQIVDALEGIRNDRPAVGAGERPAAQPSSAVVAPEGEGASGPGGVVSGPAGGVGAGERPGGAGAHRPEPAEPAQPGERGERPPVERPEAGSPRDEVARVEPEPEPARADEHPPAVTEPSEVAPGSGTGGGGVGVRPDGSGERDVPGVTPAPENIIKTEDAVTEPDDTALTESVYEAYKPQRIQIKGAKPHPGALVQSAAMASVMPPKPTYSPNLPQALIKSGALSDAQLEAIVYAGNAHSEMLPAAGEETPLRRGFFIGDGTGVGKGREIAGIILDNFQQGRKKAVWVSEKKPLINDARRDWTGLDQSATDIMDHGATKAGDEIKAPRGILFTTYDTLKSAEQVKEGGEKARGKERVQQIADWLGKDFDGPIIFDEAHNLGNSMDVQGGRGIKKAAAKAIAGVELQRLLPNARVVYVSATGATEVSNLAYADRLGLWGKGTAFANKGDFLSKISSGGIAAMELVARDMKALGYYVARNLSYDGVEYDRVEHVLSKEQRGTYDKLAEGWQIVLQNFQAALAATGGDKNAQRKSAVLSAFWGAHQRFFNQIITSMQMPSVLRAVEKDIKEGRQAVLQLVSTMEAAQERALGKVQEGDDLEDLDMTPRDQLMHMVENAFPVQEFEEYEDENGNVRFRPVVDSAGEPVVNKAMVAAREKLLDQLGSLKVPDGPLEMILNHFGTDKVAEVTGRKQRVVKKPDEHGVMKTVVEKRPASANVVEANAFQDAKKPVLVFSAAGGTGRSYHADINAASAKARRSHYLVQPGWRADAAVQGFGRTHRTNQKSAPIFHLVTTDLQGQKRFISSIARRLAQLGALTKGERRTGDQGLFGLKDNLESDEARGALVQFFKDVHRGGVDGITIGDLERGMGLKLRDPETGGLRSDLPPMSQFLNRLLSLKIDDQNRTFNAFAERFDDAIDRAAASGTLDTGVETYKADRIAKKSDQVVYTDPHSGAETRHVHLEAQNRNKPASFADVAAGRARTAGRKPQAYVQNNRSGRIFAVTEATSFTNKEGQIVDQYRLTSPLDYQLVERSRINRDNWTKIVDLDEAKKLWDQQVAQTPEFNTSDLHLITGAVLPIWDRLGGSPKIFRLQTTDGERMLGRVVDNRSIAATLQALGAEKLKVTAAPEEIAKLVLSGDTARMANGWSIKRSIVAGEPRLELVGPDFSFDQQLKKEGVFSERIAYVTRYFIPTGEDAGKIIAAITDGRPITQLGNERSGGEAPSFGRRELTEPQVQARLKRMRDAAGRGALVWVEQDGNQFDVVTPNFEERSREQQMARRIFLRAFPSKDAAETFARDYEKGLRQQIGPSFGRKLPFYSAVERAVLALKQEKGTGEQMLSAINKTPGVKADEMKWLALDSWLRGQKSVTKAEIADYVRANALDVQEVWKGANVAHDDILADQEIAQVDLINALPRDGLVIAENQDPGARTFRMTPREIADGLTTLPEDGGLVPTDLPDRYRDDAVRIYTAAHALRRPEGEGTAKFNRPDLVLPGGTGYREVVLTLPGTVPEFERLNRRMMEKYGSLTEAFERWTPAEEAEFDRVHGESVEREYRGETSDIGFRSPHWDEPNVLAHVRFSEHTAPDGKRVLLIEETQSDWHQKGRKGGYGTRHAPLTKETLGQILLEQDAALRDQAPDMAEAVMDSYDGSRASLIRALENDAGYPPGFAQHVADMVESRTVVQGVPDAPFKTSWPALTMKRMIQYAVDNGFDRLAWVPGDVQNARYDLSKHIDRIVLHDNSSGGVSRAIMAGPFKEGLLEAFDHSGQRVISQYVRGADQLPDIIGKEAADKLMAATPTEGRSAGIGVRVRRLDNADLKMGGEGMRGFYDRILPAETQKIVGKFGAKVGKSEITYENPHYDTMHPTGGDLDIVQPVHSVDITDALRKAVTSEGLPLFERHAEAMKGPDAYPHIDAIQAVIDEAARITGGKVRIEAYDPDHHYFTVRNPDGSTQRVYGYAMGRLIRIAVEADPAEMAKNLNHEVLHVLRAMGVFTPAEWRTLEAAAKRGGWEAKYDIANRYSDKTASEQTEEAIAEEMARGETPKPGTFMARMLAKVRQFFERLRNLLAKRGFQTAEDVFERVRRGEVGEREPGSGMVEKGPRTVEESQQALREWENAGASAGRRETPARREITEAERKEFHRLPDKEITEAKFILPDGRLLGGHDEAHEYVAGRLGYGTRGEDSVDAMVRDTGAVRIGIAADMFEGGGEISITERPTEAQIAKMAKYVNAQVERSGRPVNVSYLDDIQPVHNGGELRRMIEGAGPSFGRREDQTETPAFKGWFKDSKAVDAEGKPLVVYHGTGNEFEAFSAGNRKAGHHASGDLGFFFTADPAIAEEFMPATLDQRTYPPINAFKPGAQTVPTYLSIQKPFVMPARAFMERFARGREEVASFRADLEKRGYDGIVIKADEKLSEALGGEEYGADAWVAFRPEQIKSAIGNRGTFDPNDARISFGRRRKGQTPEDEVTEARRRFLARAEPLSAKPGLKGGAARLGLAVTGKLSAPLRAAMASDGMQKLVSGQDFQSLLDQARALGRNIGMLVDPMALGSDRAQAAAKDFANTLRRIDFNLKRLDDVLTTRFPAKERALMGEALDEQSVFDQRVRQQTDAMWEDVNARADEMAQEGTPRRDIAAFKAAEGRKIEAFDAERKAEYAATGAGLARLNPQQRSDVDLLDKMAQVAWTMMQKAGIVDGRGLPHYMPRYFVNVSKATGDVSKIRGGEGRPPAMEPIGGNLRTAGPGRRHHLTPEETAAAAKAKLGDEAELVTDIRALVSSLQRSQRAVAGRNLVDAIREIGRKAGVETVADGPRPDFFTIDHPALSEWRPTFKTDEEGNLVINRDEDGRPIFEQRPIYIADEFRGPLNAVLSRPPGALYSSLMQLKSLGVSLIMASPMTHNMVIFGKAFPLMPGKMLTLQLYRDGHLARTGMTYRESIREWKTGQGVITNPGYSAFMSKMIQAGMVPINGGWLQDILGMAQEIGGPPGKSIPSKVAGAVAGLISKDAKYATRHIMDAAGDFWHGTLLWERIADLQAGIAQVFYERLMQDGATDREAALVAAHIANRFAGVVPNESTSNILRRIQNLVLFSRQFTLGNLGIMRDVRQGLPSDVQAQLKIEGDHIAAEAARSTAKRYALGAFIKDFALFYGMNALVQTGIQAVAQYLNDPDDDKLTKLGHVGTAVLQGYVRRFLAMLQRRNEHPLDWIDPRNVLTIPEELSPLFDHEPGKQDRIFIGTDHNGRGIYVRNPFGKVGEEFKNWLTRPITQLKNKLSPFIRPLADIASNTDSFGRAIYDVDADGGLSKNIKAIGDSVAHYAGAQIPAAMLQGGYDYVTGAPNPEIALGKSALPFLSGVTISQGNPMGRRGAVEQAVAKRAEQDFLKKYPKVKEAVESGDIEKAAELLESLGERSSEIRQHLRNLIQPDRRAGPKGYYGRQFEEHATPADRERLEHVED